MKLSAMRWTKLNTGFDAEPNAPIPRVTVNGCDVLVRFFLNPFIWGDVQEQDEAALLFHDVFMCRIGSTNDEGFYRGQCRFSNTGIPWGDFYELQESDWQRTFPDDLVMVLPSLIGDPRLKHYLYYFRDQTFECLAKGFDYRRLGRA